MCKKTCLEAKVLHIKFYFEFKGENPSDKDPLYRKWQRAKV